MRMLQEEAEHLARRIGPLRVSVGSSGAAPRPGVAAAMDQPLLEHRLATGVGVEGAGVGVAPRHMPAQHLGPQFAGLGDMAMRLRSVTPLSVKGLKRSGIGQPICRACAAPKHTVP